MTSWSHIESFLFKKKILTTNSTTKSVVTTETTPSLKEKHFFSSTKNPVLSTKPKNVTSKPPSKLVSYKVTKVLDGDTIIAKNTNTEIKIRFRCVDAPEKTQEPWGKKSIKKLTEILPVNSEIYLNKTR